MADILNMTLKKDVFESIVNGTSREVLIDKTDWWRKRLTDAINGGFKDFKTLRISSGSAEKFDYPIWTIEERDDNFAVVIAVEVDLDAESEDSDYQVETTKMSREEAQAFVDQATVDEINKNIFETEIKEFVEPLRKYTTPTSEVKSDVKEDVMQIFDAFCEFDDVYPINYATIVIRPNGQIIGCKKRLVVDRDAEVRLNFEKQEIVHFKNESDADYLNRVSNTFKTLLTRSYVFVNKNKCGFSKYTSGEDVFNLTLLSKKKYMFRK